MSLEEGIKSTDVATIKAARGIAKGQVTKNVNYLRDQLVIEEGKFVFEEIDDNKIQEYYLKLEKAVVTFEDLHERYKFYYTEKETDPEKKKTFHEEENIFRENALKDFNAINRCCIKYKKALAASIEQRAENSTKEMKLALLTYSLEAAKKDLIETKEHAKTVIESTDEYVRSTANLMKEKLRSALSDYEVKLNEYNVTLISLKRSQDEDKYSSITAAEEPVDKREIMEVETQLSALINKTKALGESILIEASSNSINAQSNKNKTEIARLQKLSCPKFSGSPREYVRFKREFCELVSVPGRSDIEIGKNLKNAVPERYLHLINHLPTSDHEGMMKVLDEKFGPGYLVRDQSLNPV